jgi:alkyl sulfatase BDS1-like metallo-beta-lactamase superfamily hydrolase
VKLPPALLERPYLRPVYDEPEFVVHNIWRLYGGWYDGNPANLKPAPEAALAAEIAALAGGTAPLVARARELADAKQLRLACHLVELAARAEPESREAHAVRAEIYSQRRHEELSLMAKGVYAAAARESAALSDTS